jgi:tetratricopeptide (TPR) repeat protein
VILSTNTSQALASEAIQGRFDALLVKPFGVPVLEAVLRRVYEEELGCPDYLKSINAGEAFFTKGDLAQANACFTRALSEDRRPALAHSCLARLAAQKGKPEAAIESYRKALQESQVHYPSLIELERLLISSNRKEEAYSVVRRLALYYPMDTDRLALALRLAIESRQLDDIDQYFEIFELLPTRPKILMELMSAALVVAGRHFLESHRERRGYEFFERVGIINSGNIRFLRRIVEILVLLDERDQARHFLELFPKEYVQTGDYIACELIVSTDPTDAEALIRGARALVGKGIRTPGLYEALLKAHSSRGEFEEVARRLKEARAMWPHRSEDFEAVAQVTTSQDG